MLYLILVTGYTALMCLVYVLFLRNRPMHAFNRMYLLAAAVLPVVIPFLKFPEAIGEQIRAATSLSVRLPEVVVGTTQQPASYDVIATVYLCVSLVLLGAFIYKLVSLGRVIAKSEKVEEGSHTLVMNSGYGPGSWFSYIFLPDNEQNKTIIEHEVAHIQLNHTRDIIFLNLLQLFFWPNLLLIWIKKELMQVHEFQADEAVAGNSDGYSELLVSSAFNRCTLPMSHSFIVHPIRRRLMMLKKKGGTVKYVLGAVSALVTVGLFVGVVGVQSCKSKSWNVDMDKNFAGENEGIITYTSDGSEEPITKADKMPEFPGGQQALMSYLMEHTKYPEEARKKGVEGKVMVRFLVDKNGRLKDVETMPEMTEWKTPGDGIRPKYPDSALAKAAIEVVKDMPNWVPGEFKGEKVAVSFILPVSFKLD